MTSSWKKTAQIIAEDALAKCGDNEEQAIEYIEEYTGWCSEVINTAEAYKTVYEAFIDDNKTFDIAKAIVESMAEESKELVLDIDKVIENLAYWIMHTETMNCYWELVNKNKEEESENVEKEEVIIDD